MSFSLGVFEVYGDALPGGLLLAVLYYIAWRNGIVDLSDQAGANSVVLLIVAFAISMIVGNLLGPLWLPIERTLRRYLPDINEQATVKFKQSNKKAGERPYVEADLAFLRSALQMTNSDAATEVMSLQARSKMIYHAIIPLSIAAVVAATEVFSSAHRWFALLMTVVFVSLVLAALDEGRRKARWTTEKTLELSAWIPRIDQQVEAK